MPSVRVDDAQRPRWTRLRAAWRHRSVRAVAVVLVVVVLAGAAGGVRLAWRYRQLERVPVAPLESGPTAPDGSASENFLLVGSDSRAFVEGGADAAAFGTEGEVGPPHADTILLVRTFPHLDRVAMVSLPRDLYLPIAGTGGRDRINAAVQGGPDRLVLTISENLGIPVHHYAEIDFRGFKGLVEAVDGVRVPFPSPVRDFDRSVGRTKSGLDIPEPGCVRLDGDQALAYVRSRHYERLIEGEWHPDPAGDLDRIRRQQDFIRRTFHQTLSKGLLDPRRVDRLLSVGVENVTLDETIGLGDLADIARQFRSLTPDALQSYVLPTTPTTTPEGKQVLLLDEVGARPVLDVFRGVTEEPAETLTSTVRIRVMDASGRSGQLRAAAFRLAAAGFDVADVGPLPMRLERTRIRYGVGQEQAAALVAQRVAPPPELVADPGIRGVDLVLDIGGDWDGVVDAADPVADAPPTSEAPAPPAGPASAPPTTAPELNGC